MNARKRPWLRPLCVGVAAILGASMGMNPTISGENTTSTADGLRAPNSITRSGNGDFRFDGPDSLSGSPVHVWYNAPPSNLATAQILIVMTGAHRDGEQYRADWVPLLAGRHTLLLVLEFSRDHYPDVAAYNLGGIVDSKGRPQPREMWSFNMVEAVFDHVVRDVGSTATHYAIFGHSAGAQFVHRFVEFMPESRAHIAVAANAGWYTVPDDTARFPYGIKRSPLTVKELAESFSRRLVVMLGADDVDPRDSSLQRDSQTDEQGENRLARGLNFYRSAREAAGDAIPFHWQLITVPGVAHDHGGMARAAVSVLLQAEPPSP